MSDLTGNTTVAVGASRGLGRGIASAFAQAGAPVIVDLYRKVIPELCDQQIRQPQEEDTIMRTTPEIAIRELDHRRNDGIDVRLLWNPSMNRVTVALEDERAGESFELHVEPRDALAAFHHPYAYANSDHTNHALAA
jgi:NAD(P)-dependent dehydrogenase (short-subunit alcohol dehydrogenase family)